MQTKLLALLIACTALTGCCASGTGCSTQTAGAPIAWDGLGEPPTRNQEIILGPLNGAAPQADAKARYDDWTRQPNEDLEADARLARQTKICKGC